MPPHNGPQRPRPAEGGQGVRQPSFRHHRELACGPRHLDRPRRGTLAHCFLKVPLQCYFAISYSKLTNQNVLKTRQKSTYTLGHTLSRDIL